MSRWKSSGRSAILDCLHTALLPSVARGCGSSGASRFGDTHVTEQEIEAKVIDIVAEQMSVDKAQITRETSFVNDLNADSLDVVELVMEFEDEFETSIPDDEAEKIKTVGEAVEYISRAKQSAGA